MVVWAVIADGVVVARKLTKSEAELRARILRRAGQVVTIDKQEEEEGVEQEQEQEQEQGVGVEASLVVTIDEQEDGVE